MSRIKLKGRCDVWLLTLSHTRATASILIVLLLSLSLFLSLSPLVLEEASCCVLGTLTSVKRLTCWRAEIQPDSGPWPWGLPTTTRVILEAGSPLEPGDVYRPSAAWLRSPEGPWSSHLLSHSRTPDPQKKCEKDFPGGPVVKTFLSIQGVWVWSLAEELRSRVCVCSIT